MIAFKKLLSRLALLLVFLLALTTAAAAAPPEPDYSKLENWVRNESRQLPVNVFLIGPTATFSPKMPLNADINDAVYNQKFVSAVNMLAAVFEETGNIYAPHYRQAAFRTYTMPEAEAAPVLELAYQDVRRAFVWFLAHSDLDRPFILAGFSQGAQHLLRLLKEFGAASAIQQRLIAAYAIGWRLTADELAAWPHLTPAQGERDTGVIITYTTEAPDIEESIILPRGVRSVAINPLNWSPGSAPAAASHHPGACLLDKNGQIKKELPHFTGAYIDPGRGALKLTGLNPADWKTKGFPEGVYHLYDFMFFFRSLQQNAAVRAEEFFQNNTTKELYP